MKNNNCNICDSIIPYNPSKIWLFGPYHSKMNQMKNVCKHCIKRIYKDCKYRGTFLTTLALVGWFTLDLTFQNNIYNALCLMLWMIYYYSIPIIPFSFNEKFFHWIGNMLYYVNILLGSFVLIYTKF